mgnify:CR=1 FL=1
MTNPDALFDFAVDKIEFACTDVNLGSCNPLLDDSNSNTLVDEIWNELFPNFICFCPKIKCDIVANSISR